MLKKITVIFLIFFGLVLLTLFAVFAGLKFVFTEERVRKLSSDGIRGFTSREASFGKIRWGLYGLVMEDIAVSSGQQLSGGKFLTMKKISISPVFSGGRLSASIAVESPGLIVSPAPDKPNNPGLGRYLMRTPVQYSAGSRPPRALFPLRIIMTGGRISIQDGHRTEVENIKIYADSGVSGRFLNVKLEAALARDGDKMDIISDMTIDAVEGAVKVNGARIVEREKSIAVSGGIKGLFSDGSPRGFDIRVKGDRVVLDKLLKAISPWAGSFQLGERESIDLLLAGGPGGVSVKAAKN